MSIVSGFNKYKDYIKTSSGYKLISRWTKGSTVECDDGKTVQTKIGGISGISSSLTANSTSQAASTNLTNQLYQKINSLTSSFQDGCNSIYNACKTYGATPSSNSPSNIVNAIKKIYTDRYNSGYNAGKKDGGFSSATDISSKITGYASQNHGFRSSENLSTYKYIVVCATYQKNKTANFSNFSGCSCLKQIAWISNGDSTDAVSTHLVILHNITGAINVWASSVGTGNHEVGAFGFK